MNAFRSVWLKSWRGVLGGGLRQPRSPMFVPRTVTGTCPSAVAVGAIHAQVSASHAAFGARLADTAAGAHGAAASYYIMDAEQNAQALSDGINGAV
jgi:hypothetical protein